MTTTRVEEPIVATVEQLEQADFSWEQRFAATAARLEMQRHQFVTTGLERTYSGVIRRDARKIALTAAAIVAKITGQRRREEFVTEALQDTFDGVIYRDARKIAQTVLDMNERFDRLQA